MEKVIESYPVLYQSANLATLARETQAKVQQIHKDGTPKSTIRAIEQDLQYFWSWAEVVWGITEPSYPIPIDVLEAFIVDHVSGMNPDVENILLAKGVKRKLGSHKTSTVARRIASLSSAHQAHGFSFDLNPCQSFRVKKLLQNAQKSAAKNGERKKQRAPVTLEMLAELLKTCHTDSLIDKRDAALLLFGWSTGGRRRSEIAAAICENLHPAAGKDYLYFMSESKGDRDKKGITLPVCGIAATYLTNWIVEAGIFHGPIFRQIDRHGRIGNQLSGKAINEIIKKRVQMAGYNAELYGGHSLRAGFSTECGLQNISLNNQMMLTTHKTVQTALDYRRPGEVLSNPAARLADKLIFSL